jgi:hypothetical protein
MKKSLIILFTFLLFFTGITDCFGQHDRKLIREGNSKYRKGKFAESELLYRKATDENSANNDAQFNLGNALFRQQKYSDAQKVYAGNADKSDDIRKKSNALYNLGNSFLKQNNPQDAIEAYKNSLTLNPGNVAAKYNLAYAQDLLKKQQEQKNKDEQKENKEDDKKDNKDNKQDEKKPDDQNKDQQDQGNDKKEQPKDQQNDKQNEGQNNKDGNESGKDGDQQQKSISKEDASRLLDALANDEKKVKEKVEKAKGVAVNRSKINW